MLQRDAGSLDLLEQVQHALHGIEIGIHFGDLRADVAVDADHAQAGQAGGVLVGLQRIFVRDAELVALEAGGDVGVGFGIDVGVDADADGGAQAHAGGNFGQHVQLGQAFDVEAADAGLQRLAHLGACLADAGENDFGRIATGGQRTLQLATGNDVEAAAGLGKYLQHGQRGVGLHGVTDLGVAALEATLVGGQRVQHGGPGVDEQRGRVLACQLGHGDAIDSQGAGRVTGQERGSGEGGHGQKGQCRPVYRPGLEGMVLWMRSASVGTGGGAGSVSATAAGLPRFSPGMISSCRRARCAAPGSVGR